MSFIVLAQRNLAAIVQVGIVSISLIYAVGVAQANARTTDERLHDLKSIVADLARATSNLSIDNATHTSELRELRERISRLESRR